MTEEKQHDSSSDLPASSVFLEMMRQQAAHQSIHDEPEQPTPSTEKSIDEVEDDVPIQTESITREQLQMQRVQRRRRKRRRHTAGLLVGIFRSLFTVGLTSVITATIFTWWQGPEFLSSGVRDDLSIALATATVQGIRVEATALPVTPNWLKRVGIVSGHRGPENDPGAVCPDGLTEAEINFAVAERVVRNLQARGYTVDLLDEFDPRLNEYTAELIVSIHANTCQDYGELVSGYLISTADSRSGSGNDQLVVECIASYYGEATQLTRRTGLTRDMTDYHIFREIHPRTPGAIIELGFMFNDRALLTGQPDLLASGITNGILCYLEPNDPNILATLQAPLTPTPPILPTIAPTVSRDT